MENWRDVFGSWYAENMHWAIPSAMILATIVYKFLERRNRNEENKGGGP